MFHSMITLTRSPMLISEGSARGLNNDFGLLRALGEGRIATASPINRAIVTGSQGELAREDEPPGNRGLHLKRRARCWKKRIKGSM